jgi:hypothetical protein
VDGLTHFRWTVWIRTGGRIGQNPHPPHFHATYGEFKMTVAIRDGTITGRFPRRAQAYVLEWLDLHRDELLEDWELARAGRPLKPVSPLE